MKRLYLLLAATCLLVAGCDAASNSNPNAAGAGDQDTGVAGTSGTSEQDPVQPDAGRQNDQLAAKISADGKVTLSPENAKIEFVGTHVGPTPDPKARTGGFKEFQGVAQIDTENKTLQSASLEIQTGSLWTEQGGKLTNHLKNPDFFDAREHPTAEFKSTKISKDSDGGYTITGDLTLLGNTKQISFPAQVTIDDENLMLTARFEFDRTAWGMDKMTDRVNKEVTLMVTVGEKNQPREGVAGGGGRGRGRGAGAGRGPGGGGRSRGGRAGEAGGEQADSSNDQNSSQENSSDAT